MLFSRLRAWKESASSHLCLDLRAITEYQARHFVPSTNIPWSQLRQRCAELPPKRLPFAVVEPADARGCASWLVEHGWQCPWVFWEGECNTPFWTDACEAGWAERETMTKQWLLFSPCPFLAANIDMIERDFGNSKAQCLDIGCGSGRDTAWLLSRNRAWQITALDSLRGAVERTETLAAHLGSRDRLKVVQAKIMANGAWKDITRGQEEPVGLDPLEQKRQMFSPGVSTAEFFGAEQFDLVLTIRFLVRSLLPQLPQLLRVGGYLVISHFVEDGVHTYDQPRKEHRLALGELRELYESMGNMEVLVDIIEEIEDGRPVNSVVIRRMA
ncbi:hypothetical protein DFQ28_002431 [Apophysomyces sp. BC1034]|nr:hypothetical protein DFQ30_000480 [Apophysomyces sp. BC1015]KAG0177847.1 hypothetical protein DFQ29_004272 [Apophysomyces sp. BC1021]KAG0190151.1 hypothetical protein DFQ28_002431 [Apophysomyces sp. BC1034]